MKTNLDKIYKTSEDQEKNGVWFYIFGEDTGFLVRAFKPNNPQVKGAIATHYKPYARQIELGTIEDKKSLEIQVKVFVKACLVDWKGVEIDGKDTPYSPEVAIKFFCELPDLFSTIWAHCNDFKNYREDAGNL